MLSVYVNTEINMPKPMFDALTRFECMRCFIGKKTCTQSEVEEFLAKEYPEICKDFKLEYLIPHSLQ